MDEFDKLLNCLKKIVSLYIWFDYENVIPFVLK
jgi:hypothetical protein